MACIEKWYKGIPARMRKKIKVKYKLDKKKASFSLKFLEVSLDFLILTLCFKVAVLSVLY